VAASWAACEADEQPEHNKPDKDPDDFAEHSPAQGLSASHPDAFKVRVVSEYSAEL
jgi:hypothetical protein